MLNWSQLMISPCFSHLCKLLALAGKAAVYRCRLGPHRACLHEVTPGRSTPAGTVAERGQTPCTRRQYCGQLTPLDYLETLLLAISLSATAHKGAPAEFLVGTQFCGSGWGLGTCEEGGRGAKWGIWLFGVSDGCLLMGTSLGPSSPTLTPVVGCIPVCRGRGRLRLGD